MVFLSELWSEIARLQFFVVDLPIYLIVPTVFLFLSHVVKSQNGEDAARSFVVATMSVSMCFHLVFLVLYGGVDDSQGIFYLGHIANIVSMVIFINAAIHIPLRTFDTGYVQSKRKEKSENYFHELV